MFKININVDKFKQKLLTVLIFNLFLFAFLPFVCASTKYSYEDDIEFLFNLRHHPDHSKSHQKLQPTVLQNDQPQDDIYDGDELIYSGSGCYDDEDRCSSYTDTGSGDDLITPVYIPSKPSTSTPLDKVCDEDDNDCLNKNRIPNENIFSENKISFKSYSNPKSDQVWTQSSYTEVISHTSPSIDDYEVRVTLPSRIFPGPVYQTTRKIIPPRPTGIPSVNYVPPPQGPVKIKKKEQPPPPVTHKSSADKTAMIIGLVAIMLIVIVIITPLVLFIKYKMGLGYKSSSNNFRFIPKSSTPPLLTSPSHQSQLNGALVKTLPRDKSIKLGKKNDLKEWYV